MAAAIGVLGLGGVVAVKAAVGRHMQLAALVWRMEFRFRAWLPLVCFIGSLGALSALSAIPR